MTLGLPPGLFPITMTPGDELTRRTQKAPRLRATFVVEMLLSLWECTLDGRC